MINEGGRVEELTELWKQWMSILHEHNIEPTYEWRPREENARADKLSKQVPLQWHLAEESQQIIRSNFPGEPWVLPDLNQLSNTLKDVQESASATGLATSVLLVHPVWPASPWWNKITAHVQDYADLPPASRALSSAKAGKPGPPGWPMRASYLMFRPRSCDQE